MLLIRGGRRADHVTVLKLEEKAIILREKDVLHQLVVFDHLEKVHDIQISRQHFLPLRQLKISLSLLQVLQSAL